MKESSKLPSFNAVLQSILSDEETSLNQPVTSNSFTPSYIVASPSPTGHMDSNITSPTGQMDSNITSSSYGKTSRHINAHSIPSHGQIQAQTTSRMSYQTTSNTIPSRHIGPSTVYTNPSNIVSMHAHNVSLPNQNVPLHRPPFVHASHGMVQDPNQQNQFMFPNPTHYNVPYRSTRFNPNANAPVLPSTLAAPKRRKKYHEVIRRFQCNYEGCQKSYGTLENLNSHIIKKGHGTRRKLMEFKNLNDPDE